MMTLNAFYGAGRVTRIRDGQDGRNGAALSFELAVGRGVRLGCKFGRRLANRLNGFPLPRRKLDLRLRPTLPRAGWRAVRAGRFCAVAPSVPSR